MLAPSAFLEIQILDPQCKKLISPFVTAHDGRPSDLCHTSGNLTKPYMAKTHAKGRRGK